MTYPQILTLIAASLALIISILSYFLNLKKNRKDASKKRNEDAMSINKLFLSDTRLLSIYDKYKDITSGREDQLEIIAIKEAFFDYLLLTMENVYEDLCDSKTEEWYTWENSFREVIKRSEQFRIHIAELPHNRPVFRTNFSNYMSKLVAEHNLPGSRIHEGRNRLLSFIGL